MAKNKMSLEFKGFDEMIAKLEALNGDTKQAVEGCLRVASDTVAVKATQAMRKHKRTGRTASAIVRKAKPKWQGMTASIDVGFDLLNGGMPSIYLMYGTPRHGPKGKHEGHPGTHADKELYNAVYGPKTKREIAKKQEAIISGMIHKRMGG